MNITLLQRSIEWAQPSVNRQRAEVAILSAPKSDVYVLPEMWSTGFVTSPGEHDTNAADSPIEGENGITLQWMQGMAKRMDAAIAGSMAIKAQDGSYRNRFYFVTPNEVRFYDKHHLFTYSGEHHRYTAGQERVVVEFRGVRFLLQVCYDLRFPMWCRNQMDEEGNAAYDLIIYVADWPLARRLAWETLMRARAIENQCFVAACNRVGKDDWGEYFGGSAVVHPYGHLLAEAPQDEECEITGEINMEELNRYRTKFPTLKDIIWKKDYC